MGLWKATWFFEGFQNARYGAGSAVGWTESWSINDGSNQQIDNVFTNQDVLTYTALRQQCLSNQYRMSFLRINALPQPGVIPSRLVKIQSLDNRQGGASGLGGANAQVQCAILIDGQKLPQGAGDRVHHRKFLCRGLPADVINGNIINDAAPNWTKFVQFFNFVANKPTGGQANPARATQLGIAYQDPAFPRLPCPALTVLPGSPRIISFNDITAYAAGEPIKISGWTGIDGVQFNRVWNFISSAVVGPNTVASFGKSRFDMEPGTTSYPNAAFLQRVRLLVGPLDQYAVIGLRSKRTGRVFHQLRGRSARRVRP